MPASSDLPFLRYGAQTMDEADIEAVVEVLRGDWLTTGPAVGAFESKLSEACGNAEAVVVANGSVALQVAMHALGIGPGTCVVVPAVTFLASANSARYLGADVVFADVDPHSGLMTPESCEDAIAAAPTPVKAIVPVHLGGRIVDMAALKGIANRPDAALIEDACHALGGAYGLGDQGGGRPVGSCPIADMAVFSFHPVKTITSGEGGAILCQDSDLAAKMRQLRHHGIEGASERWENTDLGFTDGKPNPWYHEMQDLGYNFRLTDMQCALGMSQLRRLDGFVAARAELAEAYDAALGRAFSGSNTPVRSATVGTESVKGWHLYQVLIDFDAFGIDRATVMERLRDARIGTQVHYIPVPWQPYYVRYAASVGLSERTFPGADAFYNATLSLPLIPTMTEADVERVVGALYSALH